MPPLSAAASFSRNVAPPFRSQRTVELTQQTVDEISDGLRSGSDIREALSETSNRLKRKPRVTWTTPPPLVDRKGTKIDSPLKLSATYTYYNPNFKTDEPIFIFRDGKEASSSVPHSETDVSVPDRLHIYKTTPSRPDFTPNFALPAYPPAFHVTPRGKDVLDSPRSGKSTSSPRVAASTL